MSERADGRTDARMRPRAAFGHAGIRDVRPAKSEAHRADIGVTLIELMAVVIILSLMLGFAIYYLQGANRDLGLEASANHVAGLFRIAQQHARTTAAPAWVVVDTRTGGAHVLLKETVGEWHLEDDSGAFGRNARVSNGSRVPGRVGQGVALTGSGTIQCGEIPLHAPGQGLSIELWFFRKAGRGRGILARGGSDVEIALETDGRVSVRVGGLSVTSDQTRIPPEIWCHVQLVFSGTDLRLFLNRFMAARKAGTTTWTAGQPLVVGDARSGVTGIVDEIRLGLILPQDRWLLPAEVSVVPVPNAPADGLCVVSFDSEGRLEPATCVPPVAPPETSFVVGLQSPAGKREIRIFPSGSVQRSEGGAP